MHLKGIATLLPADGILPLHYRVDCLPLGQLDVPDPTRASIAVLRSMSVQSWAGTAAAASNVGGFSAAATRAKENAPTLSDNR